MRKSIEKDTQTVVTAHTGGFMALHKLPNVKSLIKDKNWPHKFPSGC